MYHIFAQVWKMCREETFAYLSSEKQKEAIWSLAPFSRFSCDRQRRDCAASLDIYSPNHLPVEVNHPWQVDCILSLQIISYVIANSHIFFLCAFRVCISRRRLKRYSGTTHCLSAMRYSSLSLFLSCFQPVST